MTTNTRTEKTLPSWLNLWTISIVLVVIGLLISGYLSYTKLTDTETVCLEGGEFDCDLVNNSKYAEIMGIPITYLGFATYVFIGALLFLENRIGFLEENGILLLFGITLFAFIYSMYLVYLQGEVLGAWCQWCLGHEATMTVLFFVTVVRVYQLFTMPEVEPAG
jgi:uncharacterized membrane protein